jgi:hypothetical protein
MGVTAYERILDELRNQGHKIKVDRSGKSARAQCPSHESRNSHSTPLAAYDKGGKAKVMCYAGCDDVLDILPALDMTVADLYDEPGSESRGPDADVQAWVAQMRARQEARKTMTPSQRALDDLPCLPDIGERLALGIARERPELYIWEREQLGGELYG